MEPVHRIVIPSSVNITCSYTRRSVVTFGIRFEYGMLFLIIYVNLVSLRLTYVLDRATDIFSAVSSKITSYLSSITWNSPLVAFFFAYFKPGASLNGHDILFLTCCPAHLREEVKQEHEREGVAPGDVSSTGKMVPDHDKAFVSVWGGISRPAISGDMEDFYLWLVLQ